MRAGALVSERKGLAPRDAVTAQVAHAACMRGLGPVGLLGPASALLCWPPVCSWTQQDLQSFQLEGILEVQWGLCVHIGMVTVAPWRVTSEVEQSS